MLHYVPCQTIQDRRACARYPEYCKLNFEEMNYELKSELCIAVDENVFFQWFEQFKYYIGRRCLSVHLLSLG